MDRIKTGFRLGTNKVEVLKQIGEDIKHKGRTYRVLLVKAGGNEYICERLYNAQGKFIKQFMLEPEVGPQLGRLLGNDRLEEALNEAEKKAHDSLARYKFQMFGYWASIWVHLNRILELKRPNPWKQLIKRSKL